MLINETYLKYLVIFYLVEIYVPNMKIIIEKLNV